jgi:quinol monooxygenase YgiN
MAFVEVDPVTTFRHQLETTQGPVVLINRFQIDPAQEAKFLDLWREDAAYMLARGCRSGQLHKGVAGSGTYMNVALWDDASALASAFNTPEFRELVKRYPSDWVIAPHLYTRIAVPGICDG